MGLDPAGQSPLSASPRDRQTLEPASDETARIALDLRRHRVLIGIEGSHANVLKIRPPLACRHEHADVRVDALDLVLSRRR